MKHPYFLLLMTIALSELLAQEVNSEDYSIDGRTTTSIPGFFYFNLASGFPDAQFKKAMDSEYGGMGLGFSTGFGINPYGTKREFPLLLGVDFTYTSFGRDKTTDPITDIRYKTSFNYFFVGPMARLYPFKTKKIAPFVDGFAGLQVLNGRTKLDRTLFDDNEEEVLIGAENDRSFSYGLGLGFHTKKFIQNENEAHISFFFRAMYLWGERSKHIKRDSALVVDDVYTYQTAFTTTNMFQLQLGVIIY